VSRRRRRPNREQLRRERQTAPRPRGRPGWRGTLESWGGPLVVGGILAAIVVVVAIVWLNRPVAVSEAPLLGEAVDIGPPPYRHVNDASQMLILPGEPPAGGPHFPQWLNAGIYAEPVPDGLAVHSLEHGMVWITYSPDILSGEQVERLERIARDFSADVLLSPRPENAMAVAAVSWGRILRLDEVAEDELRDFIRVNRNRSPEPGVRGGGVLP
jgi:hypothetical protein